MREANTKFSSQLNDQVRKMCGAITKSTGDVTRKLTTFEAKKTTQVQRNTEQDTKLNKLEQNHIKTVKKMAEETAKAARPRPLVSASPLVATAVAKARLGADMAKKESALNEADMREKSLEEKVALAFCPFSTENS